MLNLLSLAGLADSIVEWRCFLQLDQLIATYQAAKAWLFSLLPFHVPYWLKDYAVITASFSLMLNLYAQLAERKSIRRILEDRDGLQKAQFWLVFFTVPWIVVIWFAVRQVLWRGAHQRVTRILSADDTQQAALEAAKHNEDEKARILSRTLIGYPLVCVALLFLFSDFAYTLSGRGEIAGIQFRRQCDAGGELLRVPSAPVGD